MEYDIFISYSRKDTAIVDQFVKRLTEAGYNVWIDRDGIYSGEQFKAKIVNAIKNSAIVLFFSSVNSNKSEWTVKEISYSLKKGKTIIPIRLDDEEYEDSIDFDLINIDFISYQPMCSSATIENLIKSIAKHLGKRKPVAAPINPDSRLSSEELYTRGNSFYTTSDFKQAIYYFRLAAEKGNDVAQCDLGYCYEFGKGVSPNYEEAAKWYQKAAEQGNASAQYNLAICYERGNGVPHNLEEAIKWYSKAAEQGIALAQNNLGLCYEQGRGVVKDLNKAIYLYRKAAEQGAAVAQNNLGACYENGQGVTQNLRMAIKWYKKAAEQGQETAIQNLKRLQGGRRKWFWF